MECVFCNKEVKNNKKWHLDCLDDCIEEEFGIDIFNQILETSFIFSKEKIPFFVEELIQNGVNEGKRHITRFKIFCYLNLFNQSNGVIKQKILEFNKNCRPPDDENIVNYHINYLLKHRDKND